MDPNSHIQDYLRYYLDLPNPPRFAVLLNGPWGVGKTYLLKEFLKQAEKDGKKCIYVSLYGLASLDQVNEALLGAMYPVFTTTAAMATGRLATAALKFFRLENPLSSADIVNRSKADLFVFDDLERCTMPIDVILGYINTFVEHDGDKVVITANEDEIGNEEEYRRRREKLIGKTFEVQSALNEALRHFLSQIKQGHAMRFLQDKAPRILSVYQQSELSNLRILQQALWEFERLYDRLSSQYREHDTAMTALLDLFLSLSLEYRAGRIDADDLLDRPDPIRLAIRQVRRRMTKANDGATQPSRLEMAQERYKDIDLTNVIISNETLVNVLVKGNLNSESLNAELSASSYFVAAAQEPAWRTVWNYFDRTDCEVEVAFSKLDEQFSARAFEKIGEMLHAFGMRLHFAESDILNRLRSDITAECKKYIDDVYEASRLEPALPERTISQLEYTSYAGLGVFGIDMPEYAQIVRYLKDKQCLASLQQRPSQATKLLQEMREDPDLFFRRLNLTNSEENTFYNIPILTELQPDMFVTTLLEQHPSNQRKILTALKARHSDNSFGDALETEGPWLKDVRARLHDAVAAMRPWPARRLRDMLLSTLDALLFKQSDAGMPTPVSSDGTNSEMGA